MSNRPLCIVLCAFLLAGQPAGALGQPFPTKPIRLFVAFAPGGGTDLLARTLGQKLSQA